jgi:hypothetical protein
MANFPSIKPSARSFKPGVYPQKVYRSMAGVAVKRTYGNSPYGAQLQLEFDNIPDASVVTILDHYRSQTAANERFKLSTSVTAGMSTALTSLADASTDGLRWEYADAPDVQSVRPGINKVRVTLTGEIKDPALDDA